PSEAASAGRGPSAALPWQIVETPPLALPVAEEERVLDHAYRHPQAARVPAKGGQVADPLPHREAAAGRVGVHAPHRVQHLPRADVEHTVAARIEQRQDGRGDGDADAVEREQMLHPPALAPRGERET